MIIDLQQLMACTGARQGPAERSLDGLNSAMADYAIDTPARVGMFLANVGHETTGLVNLKELGGTTYFMRYEGRADLGNVHPGDGPKYPGRGMLQTTGRANYVRLRDRLRARGIDCPDFEAFPARLEEPQWAALSACDYVDMRHLNAKADAYDFLGYCVGVNGRNKRTGLPNGWGERTDLWKAARRVLA
jgi:putative chitinase